jgi:5-aminolevulinate synthase
LSNIISNAVSLNGSMNHASRVQGIQHSGADKSIWQHNDMSDLDERLAQVSARNQVPCIVFDSVHSADGDVSSISHICDLAEYYTTTNCIDEVHAVGLYVEHGAGYLQKLDIQDTVNVVNVTLGKDHRVGGRYIETYMGVIDETRLIDSEFIFTTEMPTVLCNAKYLIAHEELRAQHQAQSNSLIEAGVTVFDKACTHVTT